jgi:hypothetical protein
MTEPVRRPNPASRVDYSAPEVVELANTPVGDLIDDHNSGRGDRLALLFEIADEEGWS